METLSEFSEPEVIWFIVGFVLLLMELAIPSLVIFFFGIGAWIVSALCFVVEPSLNSQLLIFIVSSVLLLAILRSRLKAVFYGFELAEKDMASDIEEYIGETAIVKKAIMGRAKGRVEFHGTNWDAVADEEIAVESAVEITGKDNLTLKVRKI